MAKASTKNSSVNEPFRKTFTQKSLTMQSMKNECDVNQIVSRYRKTGVITHQRNAYPQYFDAKPVTFKQAMDYVTGAQEMFQNLPAHIREEFANSPERYLDFIANPDNTDRMVELGLIEPHETNYDASGVAKNSPQTDVSSNPEGGASANEVPKQE